jgi:hypothetical protein
MREILLTIAAGAGAWALAMLGVTTNRPFGVFLLVAGFLLVLAAHNENGIKARWRRQRLKGRTLLLTPLLVLGALAWYLATNYNEPPVEPKPIDTEARSRIADLRKEVAGLQGQVKAALEFQQREKEEREGRDRAASGERLRRAELFRQLSKMSRQGRQNRLALFDLTNTMAVQQADEWAQAMPVRLRGLSLSDCAGSFENPARGARIDYGLPDERNRRAFAMLGLIDALEQCRRDHAQP